MPSTLFTAALLCVRSYRRREPNLSRCQLSSDTAGKKRGDSGEGISQLSFVSSASNQRQKGVLVALFRSAKHDLNFGAFRAA